MSLNFGKIDRSAAFNPTQAFPLDTRSYFESLEAAEQAAESAKVAGDTTSVYYFGQTLTVIENGTAKFYIIQTDGTLKELGGAGGSSTDEKVKQVCDDSSITGDYPLLFKNSTGNSTTTDSVKFSSKIYAHPATGTLYGRLIYSECYYASDGTKLDDIYATKTEAAASGNTVAIQALGASTIINDKFKIPYANTTADTEYTGKLNQSDKFAFNPTTYALTIGNYTNPWEKTYITSSSPDSNTTLYPTFIASTNYNTGVYFNTHLSQKIYASQQGGLYASKYYTNGADFAEYFEWLDGNPEAEDRRGLLVTLVGEQIVLANSNDDCIGVITASEGFIGNGAHSEWQGKYLTDVFGTKLIQEVEVPAEIDEDTGEIIKPAYTKEEFILNPDYDPKIQYIPRQDRREWGLVGLVGQLVVVDDGTCVAGGYIAPSKNGIGTISDKGYRVMKRIDANHVKILIK